MSISKEREQELLKLSELLQLKFNDLMLLETALTHTSFVNESPLPIKHNERLEFLGDAVLELATSTYIFRNFPAMPEGQMTPARASVVCEASLAKIASRLCLGDYLLLGKGERRSGGAQRPSILADTFEAVVGAVYEDQGWTAARDYIMRVLKEPLEDLSQKNCFLDFKSLLQEMMQKSGKSVKYKILSESGPSHAKVFEVATLIDNEICCTGQGSNKKEAELIAAQNTLKKLHELF